MRLKTIAMLASLVTIVGLLVGIAVPANAVGATKRSVSLKVSSSSVSAGQAVRFEGRVTKTPRGTRVRIERRVGSAWRLVASVRTLDRRGAFTYKWTSRGSGKNFLRARVVRTQKLKSAVSRARQVTVWRSNSLTLVGSRKVLTAGETLNLSGRVAVYSSASRVNLERKVGARWIADGAAAAVSKTGVFTFTRTPGVGRTEYRAKVAPTSNFIRSAQSRPVAVDVAPAPEPLKFETITTVIVGPARVGATLSIDLLQWEPQPDRADYQWLRGGKEIVGANSATYTVQAVDAGTGISARVIGQKTGWLSETSTSAPVQIAEAVTGESSVAFDRLEIDAADGQGVAIQPAIVPEDGWQSLNTLLDLGVVVGTPFELTVDGAIPADGVKITKRYPLPLPDDLVATLGYFDEQTGEWEVVESAVSSDRRSVSATVRHLSTWTDFVSGPQLTRLQFVTNARAAGAAMVDTVATGAAAIRDTALSAINTGAEAIYYTAASLFETRVDPPTCDAPPPQWTHGLIVPSWAANAPTHWCVGSDPARPDQMVVKVRVNRGYAMPWSTTATPTRIHNTSFDSSTITDGLAALADISSFTASAASALLSGGAMVLGGDELTISLSEFEVRQAGGLTIQLGYPSPDQVLLAVLVRVLTDAGFELADGALAASVVIGSCAASWTSISTMEDVIASTISCLNSAKDSIWAQTKKMLSRIHPERSVQEIDGKVQKAMRKVTASLILLGPMITTAGYATDRLADPTGGQNRMQGDAKPQALATFPYECEVRVDGLSLVTSQVNVQPRFQLPGSVHAGDTFSTGLAASVSLTAPEVVRTAVTQLFGTEVINGELVDGALEVASTSEPSVEPLIGWMIDEHSIPFGPGAPPYAIHAAGQGPFFDVPSGAKGMLTVRLSKTLTFEQTVKRTAGGSAALMRMDCTSPTSPMLGTVAVVE